MVLDYLQSFKRASDEQARDVSNALCVNPALQAYFYCKKIYNDEDFTFQFLKYLLCLMLVLNDILHLLHNEQLLISVSGLKECADTRPSHCKE